MKRYAPFLFCAGAFCFYLLCLHAYYVGFFNDDAFYIIGARSLLQGRYAELQQPTTPPLIGYPPGYPAMLAPLVALGKDSNIPCQVLSALMTALAIGLFWSFCAGRLKPAAASGAALVLALNPLTSELSGTVLSDVPYFLLTCAVLYLVDDERGASRYEKLLFALCAAAFYIRPVAALVCAALAAAWLLEGRRRQALALVGISLGCAALFLTRNAVVQGKLLPYFHEYADPYVGPWSPPIARNAAYYARELARTFMRWPGGAGEDWFYALFLAALLALVAAGIAWDRKARGGRFRLIYFAGFCGVHLLWGRASGRYLFCALPLVIYYAFTAFDRFSPWTAIVASALSLGLGAAPTTRIVRASLFEPTPLNTPALATFDWIKRSTAPQAIFAVELEGRFFLLSGRRCVQFLKTDKPADFQRWLADNRIDYVALFPMNEFMRTAKGRGDRDPLEPREAESLLPAGARLLFADAAEETKVFRLAGK